MGILKRLIIKEWYRFFGGAVVVLLTLITVANLISGFLRQNVTPKEVLLNYLIELPSNISKVLPISCMVATLFCINKLRNRNELTAIFAAGYSRRRFILNLVQASIVVSVLSFLTSGYLQPLMKKQRDVFLSDSAEKFRNLKKAGLSARTVGQGKIWYKSPEYFFYFSAFDKKKNSIKDATLFYYSKENKLIKVIQADALDFVSENKWKANNVEITDSLNGTGFPRYIKKEEEILTLSETPSELLQVESDITTLNFQDLYDYVVQIRSSGINADEYEVMLYDKISGSIICIILAILASASVFNPNRRSSSFGKNIGFVFVFTLAYWLINTYLVELGKNSKVDPLVACFIVPVFFSIYLTIIFLKNRKLAN